MMRLAGSDRGKGGDSQARNVQRPPSYYSTGMYYTYIIAYHGDHLPSRGEHISRIIDLAVQCMQPAGGCQPDDRLRVGFMFVR